MTQDDRVQKFVRLDEVKKVTGDYTFEGTVVAAFQKRSGVWRYAVENTDGVLFILNGSQLEYRRS